MLLPEHIQDVFESAECLYSKEQVEAAFTDMANQLSEMVAGKNPLFLCVVIGGLVPLGNLLPLLDFPLEVDYLHATRYNSSTSGGDLKWLAKPRADLKDRVVVIVEDILDSGLTLSEVVQYCEASGAKSVITVALVDKEGARQPGGLQQADIVGLTVPNIYVFGYGMDYNEYLRNAPGIYAVADKHI